MAVLPIHTIDDQVLRDKAQPIEENTDELQELIDDMFETMYNSNGVGLAAPQIGREIRLFVLDADPMIPEDSDEQPRGPMAMINPEIVATGDDEVEMEEGCLSIPEVHGKVKRPDQITVKYLNRDFEEITIEVHGWLSRVIQHERDHLDGKLFIDYLSSFKRRMLKSKLNSIREGSMECEYPLVPKKQLNAQ
jgi:peptide deformylase